MSMFKPAGAKTIKDYIELIDEPRRSEIAKLHELIKSTIPDQEAKMWSSFIGYGSYHYTYASGREGDWPPVALASQKNYISVYICAAKDGEYIAEHYKDRLPKASIGKSCIRFKKLADIDSSVLQDAIREGMKAVKEFGLFT